MTRRQVTFSSIPYADVIERAAAQDHAVGCATKWLAIGAAVAIVVVAVKHFNASLDVTAKLAGKTLSISM